MTLTTLIVDYGGVLTSSLADAMDTWCNADDIDPGLFTTVLREWLAGNNEENPVHSLETGALAAADFERLLAERLHSKAGNPVAAQGLLRRMFGGFTFETEMAQVLRSARAHGLTTGLLSNSWGLDYPREQFGELFDDVVISGEVGMRKPDAEIFLLAARRLGVPPASCVFVDDLRPNVAGAVAVGMVGVHHHDASTTITELEALFGRPFAD